MAPGVRLIPKLLLQTAVTTTAMAAPLFVAAGTLDWPSAWVWLGLSTGAGLTLNLWLSRADPGLHTERMKARPQSEQKPWDKLLLAGMVVVAIAWIALMGVDARRFGWSHLPVWAQVAGAALTIAGFIGIAWVYRTNSFAVAVIRMQPERGQTVIDTGPYALVRHPMYGFGFLPYIGIPLMLGSLWGLAALPLIAAPLHLRTLGEEKMLRTELDGYRDYARRVRFRYAPGVW